MLFLTATCESNQKQKAGGGEVEEGEMWGETRNDISNYSWSVTPECRRQPDDAYCLLNKEAQVRGPHLWAKLPVEDRYAYNYIQDPPWPSPAQAASIWQEQQNKRDLNVTDDVWPLVSVAWRLMKLTWAEASRLVQVAQQGKRSVKDESFQPGGNKRGAPHEFFIRVSDYWVQCRRTGHMVCFSCFVHIVTVKTPKSNNLTFRT